MNNKILNNLAWQKIANQIWTDSVSDFKVEGLPYKGTFKKMFLMVLIMNVKIRS